MITLLMVMLTVETTAQMVNTSKVYQSERFGFSQAIIANGFVFTSGIVGWDNNYQLTGDGSFAEQAKQCFKNMELL